MILHGKKIKLQPMTIDDIPLFYKWATQSDATFYWYGELYRDKIPTYKNFLNDWEIYYFNGSNPEKGRCFLIIVNNKAIGQINYNEIDRNNNSVELDILISDDINTNKGYGSDALKTLINYLFKKMDVQKFFVECITKNPRAMRAYEKAGFVKTKSFVKNGIEWNRMECIRN